MKPRPERPDRDEHILAEAICGLGGMIGQLVRELSQINNNQAVLKSIAELKETIMSKVSEYGAAQKAYNERQAVAIDKIVASQTGITADITEMKRLIEELQNTTGEISAEDQALLDEIQAANEAATAKLEAQAAALEALDAANPPTPPPVPPS